VPLVLRWALERQVVGQVLHDGVGGHNVGLGAVSILERACSMMKVIFDQ